MVGSFMVLLLFMMLFGVLSSSPIPPFSSSYFFIMLLVWPHPPFQVWFPLGNVYGWDGPNPLPPSSNFA
jgi:hypothetical protein